MMKNLVIFILFLMVSSVVFAQDNSSVLTITTQPSSVTIAKKNESVTLTCVAEKGESEIAYQWYQNSENGNSGGVAIDGANSSEYTTEVFSDREIRFYYCVATVGEEYVTSDVAAAAYTGLPLMVIETVNHEEPSAEFVWNNSHTKILTLINETKVPSAMQIFKDGEKIYDSGEYQKDKSGLTIKLHGNQSANTEKKPYKIKLQKKKDLLAIILGQEEASPDKEWVLLKGATDLTTFTGTTVADYMGSPWTPKSTFVNVVMNGEFRGAYLLIEAVKQSEHRINVADDGYIIESDVYYAYEDVYFKTDRGNPYTFKYPDEKEFNKDETLLSFIEDYMNSVEKSILNGTYEDYIDVESFARWQLIHDVLGTKDGGGSNIYMTKYDRTSPDNPYEGGKWSKLTMSTLWDFDSIMRMKKAWAANHGLYVNYSDWLFSNQNSAFLDSYQSLWNEFNYKGLHNYLTKQFKELKNTYGEDVNLSRELDAIKWNVSWSTLEQDIEKAETWFSSRGKWLNTHINGLLLPDFETLIFSTDKPYDGTANVNYSGYIGIQNSSYINEGDDVSIKINSIVYNAKTTAAKKIVIDFELEGEDKDKYELTFTKKEIPATISALETSYGALTISTDQNGKHAVLDGNSTSALSEITSPIAVDDVVFERQFSVGKPSTIVLPFSTGSYSGGSFYTFKDVLFDEDKNKWYADITEVSEIVAHKPYIFIPSAETLTFTDGVTIEETPEKEMTSTGGNTDWTFKGVYAYNTWETVTGKEYGFAGKEAKDGDIDIAIGDFVHIGAGASIKPFRCYLTFGGESLSKSAIELPSSIEVRIVEPVATVEPVETSVEISEEDPSTDAFNEDILTPISEISHNNGTRVWSYGKTIFIEAQPNTDYQIFDINGRILKTGVTNSDHDEVSLSHNAGGIAIVRIANKSYKVKY